MTTTPKRLPLEPPDHLPVRITVEAARALTEAIKHDAAQLWDMIVTAYTERAWDVLGYGTWDQYCAAEFGSVRLRLPREERRDVVCSLRESGLSDRAIESATGISRRTLIRDRRSGGDNVTTSPEMIDAEVIDAEVVPEPTPITGTGGKTYRPKRKPKPKPEPKPTPPGGITEDTPGMTPAVEKALADAKAKTTPVAQPGEEPDQEPVEDVSDIGAMVDQALADARTAPASQEEEPKPVPEWSAAEKVAKFRLIWNCQEDEEEPEEVEDICVENLEF